MENVLKLCKMQNRLDIKGKCNTFQNLCTFCNILILKHVYVEFSPLFARQNGNHGGEMDLRGSGRILFISERAIQKVVYGQHAPE